jgi:hypothetical protein
MRSGFRQWNFEFLITLQKFGKASNLAASTTGDNFDEVKMGRAA